MFERIIGLALVIVPFTVLRGHDIKEIKSALALLAMLSLGLLSVYRGQLKAFTNKWALFFILSMWLSTMLAPVSGIKVYDMELGIFWAWKPFTYLLIYFLGIWAIASYEFKKENLVQLLNILVWCGFIMAVFTLLQVFNLDQFFVKEPSGDHPQWRLGGTLGHPTFVGAYIGIIVPIAIYLKQKFKAIFMMAMVFIIQGAGAIGAMCVSLLFLLWIKNQRWAIYTLIGLILLLGAIKVISPDTISDHNRFFEWKRIAKDIINPADPKQKLPITGKGLGSFYYTYHVIHSGEGVCDEMQAHNEYLEVLYNCGIIGLGLFLMAIWTMIKRNLSFKKYFQGNETINLRTSLVACFICSALNAGVTFAWQLGSVTLVTAFVVGLLNNKEIIDGSL